MTSRYPPWSLDARSRIATEDCSACHSSCSLVCCFWPRAAGPFHWPKVSIIFMLSSFAV